MKLLSRVALSGAAVVAATMLHTGAVHAGCGIEKGAVSIIANDFPALHAVAGAAEACAGNGVTVTKNHTAEHKDLIVPALTPNPAEYSVAIVANSTLVTLMNDGLVRPLNDLVAKHGSALKKNQLITIDGKVMAVAFMANAQHLFYRDDVLQQAGVAVPGTYSELLAAAKAIKDKGLMDYPVSGTYKAGWNLAEEFVNMYLGHGGEFFKSGSAEPAVNGEKGVATLNMMKALTEYMNPDFLTFDSNAVQAQWEAGDVALTNLWGSRAGAVLDDEGSTPEIVVATKFASAPAVGGGEGVASSLWWDGFAIAANISDEDAEASFQAMMNGVSLSMAIANPEAATWLIDGAVPGVNSVGVAATAGGGAEPYPMVPFMGLMHTALGNEIVEFLQGNESAEQALADVEAAYITAAKEGGFIN
ncbi:MAG: extracellular solute-binding protein [Gammaproteobacteria bacterium]|nr:extracellular solute-binding protein [Gammaproteobacteria bacterium]